MPTFIVTDPATGQKRRLTGDSSPTEAELEQIFSQPTPLEPETTAEGVAGAITRGAGPIAAGALTGAALGAPFAGVGALPGAVAGAGAVALTEFVGDPIVETINSLFGTTYTKPTDAMQDFFTRIGVPEASTEAERIIQSVSQGAAGAGGAVALGKQLATAATGPVIKGAGQALAAQPAAQVAGGAGAVLGGEAAEALGAGPVGQIAASLVGGAGAAKVAGLRAVPHAKQLPSDLKAAKEVGIDVLTTDVVPPKTFAGKWLQATGERIPLVGAGEVRKGQQKQRIDAIKGLLDDYGVSEVDNISDDIMKDLATKRTDDIAKYSKLKGDVISKIDAENIVPVTKTTSTIDDQISQLRKLKTREVEPVIDRLEDWKASLQEQPLTNIEALRKQIGESFKAPELTAVRSAGEKALNSIYGSLRDDMGDFIKTYGKRKDFTKWQIANKRLSALAGDLKMGTLKSVLKSGDASPEVVERMLFSKKPSEVRQLYAGLTQGGKANARTAIIARAADKAGGIENISPAKFTNEVKKMGKNIGVFFKGEELERINGLTRALDITRRAATAAEMPSTGVQAVPVVVAAFLGDLLGGSGGAIAAGLGIGGMSRAYESAPVRNLLMKLPQTIKGSPEEAALFKRLVSTITQQKEHGK